MALLSEQDRASVWARLMNRGHHVLNPWRGRKSELRAAVDAADVWVEANTASFNAALPVAYRTAASPEQKALLLSSVVQKRYGDDAKEQ